MEPQEPNSPQAVCPKCGGHDFRRWDKRHPYVIHWVLNPAGCLFEILVGARVPRVMLFCQKCNLPPDYGSYVPCPTCHTLHRGTLWIRLSALGHWFGYVCPTCHAVIPCHWNVFSLIILAVTVPIWYLPARWLKPRWLRFEQRRRLATVSALPVNRPRSSRAQLVLAGVLGLAWCTVLLVGFLVGTFLLIRNHASSRFIAVQIIGGTIALVLFLFLLWKLLRRIRQMKR